MASAAHGVLSGRARQGRRAVPDDVTGAAVTSRSGDQGKTHDPSPCPAPGLASLAPWKARAVLRGHALLLPEHACRVDRPVRIAQLLARQQHHVGAAVPDDLVGMRRLGDQADGRGRRCPPRGGPSRRTAPGSRRRPGLARARCRRSCSRRCRRPRASARVRAPRCPRASSRRRPSRCTRAAREAAGPPATRARMLRAISQREADAVLERAAVLVVARVRERRVEAVTADSRARRASRATRSPRRARAARRLRPCAASAAISSRRERVRHLPAVRERDAGSGPPVGQPPSLDRDVALRLPRPVAARLSPGVRQLDARHGAVRRDERAIRASISTCPSSQMPRSCGLIRPRASIAAASVFTSAGAADRAGPEVHECQSVANPSTLLYWHIGETPIRLRSVTPRSVIVSKRCDIGYFTVALTT